MVQWTRCRRGARVEAHDRRKRPVYDGGQAIRGSPDRDRTDYEYARGEAHINTAESFFSRLKRQLYGTHHAVSPKHLHPYVAEVAFKHNTRKMEDGERTVTVIQGSEGKRLRYRDATAR